MQLRTSGQQRQTQTQPQPQPPPPPPPPVAIDTQANQGPFTSIPLGTSAPSAIPGPAWTADQPPATGTGRGLLATQLLHQHHDNSATGTAPIPIGTPASGSSSSGAQQQAGSGGRALEIRRSYKQPGTKP